MRQPEPIPSELARAWLAARSIGRGLPAPVADHGGWRVDSGQPAETRRYLFTEAGEGLRTLGGAIDEPLVMLKLLGAPADLMVLLPSRWRLQGVGWMMGRQPSDLPAPVLPSGYTLSVEQQSAVTAVTISAGSELAARGYAIEAEGLFVYDRIVVEEAHRRRGLGTALMDALGRRRRTTAARELLIATDDGRALYATLGWRNLRPLATAAIPGFVRG